MPTPKILRKALRGYRPESSRFHAPGDICAYIRDRIGLSIASSLRWRAGCSQASSLGRAAAEPALNPFFWLTYAIARRRRRKIAPEFRANTPYGVGVPSSRLQSHLVGDDDGSSLAMPPRPDETV